jgi:hypothetical protein
VQHVQWAPRRGGDVRLADLLSARQLTERATLVHKIDKANAEALRAHARGRSGSRRCDPGRRVEGPDGSHILHAGPPIGWGRMCGPMRGAIMGIAVFEGWASDLKTRPRPKPVHSGSSPHHYDAVGPMTGMTTLSQPMLVVENRAFGNRAYCAINEGLGKVMRFGGNDAEVLARLAWLREVLGPALGRAIRETGGIPLKPIVARGLTMGDEMHQRNVACSSLLLRLLAPALARTTKDTEALARCLDFIGRNDQFFLNVAMAMGKAITDPARGVEASSVVTAMSRNGTDFGIRVSGLGDAWFTAPVEMPVGLYFPGYSAKDANPDMGDSAIVETVGLGGFAMAAAPAVVGFVGAGPASSSAAFTRSMGRSPCQQSEWTIPALDGAGVPVGTTSVVVGPASCRPSYRHRPRGAGWGWAPAW